MYKIEFYSEKVKDDLRNLPIKLKVKIFYLISILEELGNKITPPDSIKIKGIKGAFELRAKAQEGISRCFYCFQKNKKIYILHIIVKKGNKTPIKDLEIVKRRIKEIENEQVE